MVPPRSCPSIRVTRSLPLTHSVISPTTGSLAGPNSVDEAPLTPATFRTASITAICIPKQMPK